MFYPPPSVMDVSGLFRLLRASHSRRSSFLVIGHSPYASTFLHPLAPRSLLRFVATTDALTPARRLLGPCGQEHRSGPDGSPCLSRPHFQPFCPQPPRRPNHDICFRSLFLSVRGRRPLDRVSVTILKDCSFLGLDSGFAQRSQARRTTWLNRVYVASCLACHVVTDGLFTSGSSPPRVATTQ